MDWATGVPQNPSIRSPFLLNSRTHSQNLHIYHNPVFLPQNRQKNDLIHIALLWKLPAVKKQVCMCAQPSSDPQSEEEESFWEKPEGKQKMGEIEDMKELISEAKKLKDEQEQKQKNSGDEGSRDLREEIAKVTTFILS
mgnify:CR=1 FL=1